MKDSGVEWLGEIPSHWDVKQIRRIASVFGGGTPSSEIQAYWDGDIPWLTPSDVSVNHGLFIERTRRNITDAGLRRSAAELMPTGTVLMTSRASIGDVVINTVPMATNQGFINIIPNSDKINNLYVARWIQHSGDFIRELGTGSTFFEVTKSSFKALPITLPPLHEQRAIASYLDAETARIDKLIAKTERLNELLREKRTALISQAVTKGLDAGVALKESGVEWLGEIPRHWAVKRLKFLTRKPLMYGANEAADDNRRDYPRYIRITDIKEDGSLRDDTFRSLPYEIATPYLLTEGDILFARSGATVGKTFRYQADWGIACFAGYLIRFRCDPTQVISEFVDYYTSSKPYWEWVNGIFIQATIQNISAEKYANTSLGVPPLHEQRAIASYLDRETARIDALITKNERLIDLLREKRTALISAAVTGKIAVPSVSAVVK
ncbi:MAG: restriction endonuclease subunit S [Chloroflexi bacterium]|nr:restriction endonuclease subunit S [Chloroflexota bacterium]